MKAWIKRVIVAVVLCLFLLFSLAITPSVSAAEAGQDLNISSCLARNFSVDLCEKVMEKIAVCTTTKPLDECERGMYDIAENIVKFEAAKERARIESQDIDVWEKEKERVLYDFEEPPIDPEYKEILDRIENEYGTWATRKLFLEMGEKFYEGENIDAIQFATDFEQKLKHGEEGIDLESVEIDANKGEILKLTVMTPGVGDERGYWESVSRYLTSKGINVIGEAVSAREVKLPETSIEVFKTYLMVENRTPIIKSEFTTSLGKSSKITIKRDEIREKLLLESNGVKAETELNIKLEKKGLFIWTSQGETRIKVLPDVAAESVKTSHITSIKNIELTSIEDNPIYEINGVEGGKLFAIIPVIMEIHVLIDASTGDSEFIKKPWWRFLAW